MFVAKTSDLVIANSSGVSCTRAKCRNKKNCGFIPNYPIINFEQKENNPNNGWVSIEDSLSIFESFLK